MAHLPAVVQPWPALTLTLASPVIGEFLLGNMAVDMLWLLPMLALLYGTGALLVREAAFRLSAGWPGILLLGLAYAIIEEGFVTQSLFDPNYLSLRLLDYGYLPLLGIGAWWTIFVLALHMIWSIAAAIALTECLWPKQSVSPWLSAKGLAGTALLFVAGCAAVSIVSGSRFMASWVQLVAAAAEIAALISAAWWSARRPAPVRRAKAAPSPKVAGLASFGLLSLFMLTTWTIASVPAALNVAAMIGLLGMLAILVGRWARMPGWGALHILGLTAGALLTYGWWSLLIPATVTNSGPEVDFMGNLLLVCCALLLISIASRRTAKVQGSQGDLQQSRPQA
jgi:hypothetical protein